MNPSITTLPVLWDLIVQWWTPVFFCIFVAIVLYALWPRNRATFDQAARLPLQED